MKSRYGIRVFNSTIFLIVYIIAGLYSCAHSQGIQRICQSGYEVSVGVHDFKPLFANDGSSKIRPGSRGFSIGGFIGNNLLKMRLRGLGYYEPNKAFGQTFFQYEGEVMANFYPLEFARVQPNLIDLYVTTGLNFTLAGRYSSQRFTRVSQTAGLGAEYIVRNINKTISIFCEGIVGKGSLHDNVVNLKEVGPLLPFISSVNFGVRVGYKKYMKAKSIFWQ